MQIQTILLRYGREAWCNVNTVFNPRMVIPVKSMSGTMSLLLDNHFKLNGASQTSSLALKRVCLTS